MFENLEIMRMAQAMSQHATLRQNVIARNVANADTPGYRAKDIPEFSEIYESNSEGASVEVAEVTSPDEISPDGNGVSVEDQMLKSVDVRRQYDMSLAIYRSALTVLRSSIGKG